MKLSGILEKIGGRIRFRSGKKSYASTAVSLIEPNRFPYGPFQFKFHLPRDSAFLIQSCTDLRTWNTIFSGVAKTETAEYLDSDAAKFSFRFYRVIIGEQISENVIGYAAVALPPGFSMIANPFVTPLTISDFIKGWPDGTALNRFDPNLFKLAENVIESGKWSDPYEKLMPGEGAIFFNPTQDYKSISFYGAVIEGNLSVPIPSGFSIRSWLVPQAGTLDELAFPIANGDVIHIFDRERQRYILHPYENGKWTTGPPIVGVGESFWVAKTEPGNWSRQSSLNPEKSEAKETPKPAS